MRRTILLIAILVLAIPLAVPIRAQGGYEASEHFFESADGTMLHADVFRPSGMGDRKLPVVLLVTPYRVLAAPTGQPGLAYQEFQRFLGAGYIVVQASLRGYGESDGCGDFGGVGEQMDAVAAVEWAASQDWSTGKVGMYGISYDGWTQVMAMANKAKGLEAAVVSSPLISLYRGLFMNGIHYSDGWHTTAATYAAIDVGSIGKPTPNDPECYATNQTESAGDDPSADYWVERDIIDEAKRSDVPVLWSHGFLDANTKPDNFLDVYDHLRGPRWAWFGQWPHTIPSQRTGVEKNLFLEQAIAFYDKFLKGEPSALDEYPRVSIQSGDDEWRSEREWPPSDAHRLALGLNGGTYQDAPGNDSSSPSSGVWTFSQRLPHTIHFAGTPKLIVRADAERSGAHLVALVYEVDRDGGLELITRGAYKIRGEGDPLAATKAKFSFELYPQDWRLDKGQRLGVFISGSDDSWFDPGTTGGEVRIRGVRLSLPFLTYQRSSTPPTNSGFARSEAQVDAATIQSNDRRMKLPPPLGHRT